LNERMRRTYITNTREVPRKKARWW